MYQCCEVEIVQILNRYFEIINYVFSRTQKLHNQQNYRKIDYSKWSGKCFNVINYNALYLLEKPKQNITWIDVLVINFIAHKRYILCIILPNSICILYISYFCTYKNIRKICYCNFSSIIEVVLINQKIKIKSSNIKEQKKSKKREKIA